MGGSPELPHGWNPDTDSLQDLVHVMFHDRPRSEPDVPPPAAPQPAPTAAAASAPGVQPAAEPAPAPRPEPPSRPTGLLRGRLAVPALTSAVLLAVALAGLHILATTTTRAPTTNVTQVGPTVSPTLAGSPAVTVPVATPLQPTPPPAPEPVVIGFGTRSEVGDGWRLGASRPYPCDVLMAVPVLQQDGTRIVRVTLTLTNRTGLPQPTRIWRLAATADGTPAELVLWPSAGFRAVPDATLKPGRSIRFLVAIRIPDHRVQLHITAERDAAPGAVLAGTL